ncbi:hypothetical protein OG474_00625 [Kribbella sp. NBC_01505]|uniref:hypothetical protein n=1 Tax=Kribbella sp. NBC_01505 TaxID=2903580 RepID=UPI003863C13D
MNGIRSVPIDQPPRPVQHATKHRAWLAVAAGVAVAGAVAVAALTGPGGTSPAWAIANGPGDTVIVRIKEFRDPQGLEQRLHTKGIPAIVDYIPPGKVCSRDGRFWGPTIDMAGTPGAERVETEFRISRSEIGAGQAVNIFAMTAAGDPNPVVFTESIVPASTPHCELVNAALAPAYSPSSVQPSINPTPTPRR